MERDLTPARTARRRRTTPNWVRSSVPWPRTGTDRRSDSTSRPGASGSRWAGVARGRPVAGAGSAGSRRPPCWPSPRRSSCAVGAVFLTSPGRNGGRLEPVDDTDPGRLADRQRRHAVRGPVGLAAPGPLRERQAPERHERPAAGQRWLPTGRSRHGPLGTDLPWADGWSNSRPGPTGRRMGLRLQHVHGRQGRSRRGRTRHRRSRRSMPTGASDGQARRPDALVRGSIRPRP